MGRRRKDPKMVEEMYNLYLGGKSFKDIGDEYGCSGQAVYHLFRRNGMKMWKNGIKYPYWEFNGRKYTKTTRDPNNYCRTEGNHITIQRDIWEFYNGMVPSGCIIYHIDGNRDNNDIGNLRCASRSDYFKEKAITVSRWKDHRLVEEMHMYYKECKSYREVAIKYGYKTSCEISRMFRRHGLEPKKERARQ